MGKDLHSWFKEKFDNQLKHSKTRTEAFYKAIDDAGFDAYSSYTSFSAVRSYKKKPKKRPK
jgi:hypothetical protein